MREILTGVLISHRQGAEDTRVHILHVMRSSMQMVSNSQGFSLLKLDTLGELSLDIR